MPNLRPAARVRRGPVSYFRDLLVSRPLVWGLERQGTCGRRRLPKSAGGRECQAPSAPPLFGSWRTVNGVARPRSGWGLGSSRQEGAPSGASTPPCLAFSPTPLSTHAMSLTAVPVWSPLPHLLLFSPSLIFVSGSGPGARAQLRPTWRACCCRRSAHSQGPPPWSHAVPGEGRGSVGGRCLARSEPALPPSASDPKVVGQSGWGVCRLLG